MSSGNRFTHSKFFKIDKGNQELVSKMLTGVLFPLDALKTLV